jgi:tetratricopeptide (TPR) repeat protein
VACLPALVFAGPDALPQSGVDAAVEDRPQAPPLIIDEPPEVFRPARQRTETERDRLTALAMFSAGRVLQQQGETTDALRMYQRAWRYDSESATILESIVPLAAEMGRHAVAVGYALKLAEMGRADPLLLQRLAAFLAEQGEQDKALRLYEKAADARRDLDPQAADVVLWMEVGRLYYLADRHNDAAEQFAKVLKAIEKPDEYQLDDELMKAVLGEPPATYGLMGETFVEAGRVEEAEAAFRKAYEADKDQPRLEYHLAQVEAKSGKPEQALERLEKAFQEKLETKDTGPYRLLADVLKTLNRSEELIDRLQRLREASPDNAPLGHYLAQQYFEKEQYEKAEPLYRELIEKAPTISAYQNLAKIYLKSGNNEALLDLLALVAGKSESLELLGEEAETLAKNEAQVKTLLDIARARISQTPEKAGYELRLAAALLAVDAKQYDAAGEFFKSAADLNGETEADVLLTWGLNLLVAEKFEEAAEVFRRGLADEDLAEQHAAFHYYLAGALELLDQTEEALSAARKAVELKEDSPTFQSRVAWVLYHAGRHADAAKAYRELIDRYDSQHNSLQLREILREARLVLSNVAVLQENMSEAEEWLEQVLDEFPDDVGAMNDLGYLWADQNKNLHRARRMLETAVAEEPDNEAYRDSLGWVLFRLGKIDEALEQLEKAASVEEPDPVILEHLGDAYKAGNKPAEAKKAWSRALDVLRKEKDSQPKKIKPLEDKINSL